MHQSRKIEIVHSTAAQTHRDRVRWRCFGGFQDQIIEELVLVPRAVWYS
jgi:hypothetical protein